MDRRRLTGALLGMGASALAGGLGFVLAVGVAMAGAFVGPRSLLAPLGGLLALASGLAGAGASLAGLWRPRPAGILLSWLAGIWVLGMALALTGPGLWPSFLPAGLLLAFAGLVGLLGASALLRRAP